MLGGLWAHSCTSDNFFDIFWDVVIPSRAMYIEKTQLKHKNNSEDLLSSYTDETLYKVDITQIAVSV